MNKLPIGIEDFKKIIEEHYFYIDKTSLISRILINGAEVTLFTRPRRFGKTLNMSMLYHFFDIKNGDANKPLFKNLDIEKSEYYYEQGQNPVIFISMKDVKKGTLEECKNEVYKIILNHLNKISFIYDSLSGINKKIFDDLSDNRDSIFLDTSLKYLSQFLYEYYEKKVILLIDEYDAPILSAYDENYYNDAIKFFKSLYSSALKTNEYLKFGVMTGITRVAKEEIFSDLNNLDVDTILDKFYNDYFGLTEKEVINALKEYDLQKNIESVKEWYNGYRFGNAEVYNPWSIIKYLKNKELESYWVNTSGNILINKLLNISNNEILKTLLELFSGKNIKKHIEKDMSFDNIMEQNKLWTLLLYSGYLTVYGEPLGDGYYLLKIPNKEIYSYFKTLFIDKFIGLDSPLLQDLSINLKLKKIKGENSFESTLKKIFLSKISYYDVEKK
ncbi:MAG: AAA family ATPase [Fusobacteriaceae bacterium]|jgi:hypothetical protein|nr:AAA family ATPase [Fusobacteriaceae bacterium]